MILLLGVIVIGGAVWVHTGQDPLRLLDSWVLRARAGAAVLGHMGRAAWRAREAYGSCLDRLRGDR